MAVIFVQTLANAMDVGDPSNFARIYDLYKGSHQDICQDISGATYSDEQIKETMTQCYRDNGYTLDPHGACGYRALKEGLQPGEKVDAILHTDIAIPERLAAFMKGEKKSIPMTKDFEDFKSFLMKE